jgi:DNA-binding FrmR family transcriptional regulator
MKLQNPDVKETIINRMRRIEGQVRGVQAMVAEERECREILQQLAAIRSAVQGTTQVFMEKYAAHCLLDIESKDHAQREQIIEDLLLLYRRT